MMPMSNTPSFPREPSHLLDRNVALVISTSHYKTSPGRKCTAAMDDEINCIYNIISINLLESKDYNMEDKNISKR